MALLEMLLTFILMVMSDDDKVIMTLGRWNFSITSNGCKYYIYVSRVSLRKAKKHFVASLSFLRLLTKGGFINILKTKGLGKRQHKYPHILKWEKLSRLQKVLCSWMSIRPNNIIMNHYYKREEACCCISG